MFPTTALYRIIAELSRKKSPSILQPRLIFACGSKTAGFGAKIRLIFEWSSKFARLRRSYSTKPVITMILRARALAVALGSFSSVLNVGAMDETPRVSKVYAKQAGGAMEQAMAAAHGQAPPKDRRHADMHRQLDMRRFAVQLTAEQQAVAKAATDKRRMEEQAARKCLY